MWQPRSCVSMREVVMQGCSSVSMEFLRSTSGYSAASHAPVVIARAASDLQKFLSGSGAPGGGGGSKSALLGDFTPVAQPAEAQPAGAVPDAASNATPPDTSAAPQYAPRRLNTFD